MKYSQEEKQEYIGWINKTKEEDKPFLDCIIASINNKEEYSKAVNAWSEFTEKRQFCVHERSLCSDCIQCNDLDFICFPKACSCCGEAAVGYINYYDEDTYLCKKCGENSEYSKDFEIVIEEDDDE